MYQNNFMFAWTPETNQIKVGEWPDKNKWSKPYKMTGGFCFFEVHDMTPEQLKTYLFIEAYHMIVRDGVCPEAVHNEMIKIEAFKDGLAEDFDTVNKTIK